MANDNNNPISRLLDVDFPDVKKANWNNSFSCPTTSDVGFVKPVFTDRILANTRCKLDFDSASFANSTINPLYGRYKVHYLAFWAPDRLYMRDWLSGEKMVDDDYPYPVLNFDYSSFNTENSVGQEYVRHDYLSQQTGAGFQYCPPTSLMEYLGYKPAYASACAFDSYPDQNAFAFLAFWDAYRTFILNPQESTFPIRVKGFVPEITYDTDGVLSTSNAQPAITEFFDISSLDDFFKAVKFGSSRDVRSLWETFFDYSLYPNKDVVVVESDQVTADSSYDPNKLYLIDNFHYLLPLAPYNPDYFTSWISNENVELERSKSKVRINNNEFTMEQWYLASRIQSKVRKNLYKFQDFATWIDTNYGIKPSKSITQPMFLGAFSSDIIFNDAVNLAGGGSADLNDNGNLGSRAGFGVGKDGNRSNFFDFTAEEPGTVMILQYIVPEVHYFECSDVNFDKLNFNEEFNPMFDALGFQDLHQGNMNAVPNLAVDPYGVLLRNRAGAPKAVYDIYNNAVAQQPYGFEHMARPNVLHGMMTMPNYYQGWSLARSFNYNRAIDRGADPSYYGPMGLYSSYILPEMYNNIFANNQNVDNFQFYLQFDYLKYQPISKQFLSFN